MAVSHFATSSRFLILLPRTFVVNGCYTKPSDSYRFEPNGSSTQLAGAGRARMLRILSRWLCEAIRGSRSVCLATEPSGQDGQLSAFEGDREAVMWLAQSRRPLGSCTIHKKHLQ
jgi:hypothetical protein